MECVQQNNNALVNTLQYALSKNQVDDNYF